MPSDPCGPRALPDGLQGFQNCPTGDGALDPSWFWQNPGKPLPGATESDSPRPPDVSRGFNFGLLLLPYVRDWGSPLGVLRRRKAYATIMHSFAVRTDRAYALGSIEWFKSKGDNYEAKFIAYLITAAPFAGYRWHAALLLKWQDFAQAKADELGAAASLDADAALDAAIAWCTSDVRAVWELSTRERWPWSAPDLVGYWNAATAAVVPGTLPLPP